jgi:hypothetical protein
MHHRFTVRIEGNGHRAECGRVNEPRTAFSTVNEVLTSEEALAWKFDKFDEQTWINEPPIRAVPFSPCGATVIGLYVTMTVVGATALGSSLPLAITITFDQ